LKTQRNNLRNYSKQRSFVASISSLAKGQMIEIVKTRLQSTDQALRFLFSQIEAQDDQKT